MKENRVYGYARKELVDLYNKQQSEIDNGDPCLTRTKQSLFWGTMFDGPNVKTPETIRKFIQEILDTLVKTQEISQSIAKRAFRKNIREIFSDQPVVKATLIDVMRNVH